MGIDIHNYRKRLDRTLERIKNSDVCEENKTAIQNFTSYLIIKGIGIARIEHYIHCLRLISKIQNKDFKQMTKEDVMKVLEEIQKRFDWSERYKYEFKVTLKVFFRWLKESDMYPEEVKWIKLNYKSKQRLPEEILTEEEIKALAENADNLRDKAFVLVLYESGCRIGELLTLKIRNIQLNEYGMALNVNGKTGSRRILIISSAPALANWLDTCPFKNNPDALVWTGIGNRNKYRSLSYNGVVMLLKKLAKLVEINKRVNPHSFRHSRATHLANILTEAQMKQYFGWVQGSDMASVYVHLSGRDVDSALLRLNGILKDEDRRNEILKIKICRCGEKNDPSKQFCGRCGAPLSLKTALEIENKKKEKDELLGKVLENDEELMQILIDRIKKKGLYEEFFKLD